MKHNKVIKALSDFWNDQRGSETVEYLMGTMLIMGVIAITVIMLRQTINGQLFSKYAAASASEERAASASEERAASASEERAASASEERAASASEEISASSASDEREPETQQPPTVVNKTEIHFDFKVKDVLIVVAVVAGTVVAFATGVAIIKVTNVGEYFSDYFDDKKHRGAYAYNFEGAGGMLKMRYKEFMTLFAESPGRYCVLHDDKRKMVQLILFNPTALFPYKMYFDYNSAYGKEQSRSDWHFANCSYIQLSRHDRKKLAASLRRSRYDSDGARFGTNELSSCGCMLKDADNAVINAKATCAQEMNKQKAIISNIAASALAKDETTSVV